MRLSILLGLVMLVFALLAGCSSSQISPQSRFAKKAHLGTWKGKDSSGRSGALLLYENGFAAFFIGEKEFGSPNLKEQGALLYQIDYSQEPIHLDLIGVNSQYEEIWRVKMLVEIYNGSEMRICTFMNELRPQEFGSKDPCYSILLYKFLDTKRKP